ncbi:LysM peptidoglycan-binding domain-containing protein [Bacillus aerolatus]|uniref:LysM peptidoglycan-binding domain-containing protein n=1 Tax=Bacillus aerolatus TaxID=2653354 RepID=A0A6I1FMZ9_9BACI|nr:LysM peptidoglycan-binding domain-containing protein [Bacillus aerolatus]KAB7708641.1 LysM peptidoglycan-binding domain-containing protein [Bacillus aerolatus]
MIIHVIRRGETLSQLARQYGVSASQIAAANELPDRNRLVIGQALIIPVLARRHTVRSGETLRRIAQMYGVTVSDIVQANQISDPERINPGAVLYIPARKHTVQEGETLWQIAEHYGAEVQELMRLNNIQNPSAIYPGLVLQLPLERPVIDVNAYTIEMGEEGARQVREIGDYLTYVSPFAYIMKADGGLESINDAATIQAARAEQVIPMMSITNFTSRDPGSRLAQTILGSRELQERLLTNVIRIMKNKGYQGLNVDFENVFPADRERYNQFLQRAVDRLHPEGFFVSTALAPKTRADQPGLLYEAHDYEAHGRIVDFVVLMTYEWGYRLGPPQAISPLNQIRRVLDYAVSVIPRNKIFFGFQLYARDWLLPHRQGQEAQTFDMQEAVRRATKYGAAIQYNTAAQSPFYRYTDERGRTHEVWFEDARSAQAKFDIVKEYGLRGISYWVLGYPFPQNWRLLQDNFRIRKIG